MNGTRLGPFLLLEKLGEGGMGVVYKARDTRLDRVVAIKLLPESRLADPDRRARFIREARAASALNHPNIVIIHDIAEHDGRDAIVMEFVDGKPLQELIPRKGMRLPEALRAGVQIADALSAAHAAGIVHRDLKPGNIMLDTQGRVKVLDFGLAKLIAAQTSEQDETRTEVLTDDGAIVGSVPYMSPEQAEGRPVDARSDIFSFGAVLYEMVTGQRAFQGQSRISTLSAVVEKDPPPVSGIVPAPPELDRLISRCLRKDVARRSQHMPDVKLALEELRDESESGAWQRTTATAAERRWLWPAVVGLCVVGVSAVAWSSFRGRESTPKAPELVRLSPDDGFSYSYPTLSADAKFVAYVSDRSGKREIWLHQVGGAEPIQLTHEPFDTADPVFSSDGTQIVYGTRDSSLHVWLKSIPTLGGQARVLAEFDSVHFGKISPNGRSFVYVERFSPQPYRMMIASTERGTPRELTEWARLQATFIMMSLGWSADGRFVLTRGAKRPERPDSPEWDWYAIPVNGAAAIPTGAGEFLRGIGCSRPYLATTGERVFFTGDGQRKNVWEIRLDPQSWKAVGPPRQLTFGTEAEDLWTTAAGAGAIAVSNLQSDLYSIPIDRRSGQPSGPGRRLTRDGRLKQIGAVGGDRALGYFLIDQRTSTQVGLDSFAIDLETGRQTLLASQRGEMFGPVVSLDGRLIAYNESKENRFSIRLGSPGDDPSTARILCSGCGLALRFTADGRFLFYTPERTPKADSKRKGTIRLLEVSTGKDRPWLEHPVESLTFAGIFSDDDSWVYVNLAQDPKGNHKRVYAVPWREEPVPVSEWVPITIPTKGNWYYGVASYDLNYFDGDQLMVMRFDPRTRTVGKAVAMKFQGTIVPNPNDVLAPRRGALVFSRRESRSSVWLMKLPE